MSRPGARSIERRAQYLQIVGLYATARQPERAARLLSSVAPGDSVMSSDGFSGAVHGAAAEIALARGDPRTALAEFRKADADRTGQYLGCGHCALVDDARAFASMGAIDSAITYFEQYLAVPMARRYDADPFELPQVEKQLAELYDNRGDTRRAIAHYAVLMQLWKGADPDLLRVVSAVRNHVAELLTREAH
ncbi:MAG: tetratricopeptide repeat protein [Gemmatimonadales bacterium]